MLSHWWNLNSAFLKGHCNETQLSHKVSTQMSDNSDNSKTNYTSSHFEGHGEGVCWVYHVVNLDH